jgi:hypothetical protein
MSRGPGRIQSRLLRLLEETAGVIDTFSAAATVYDCRPDADGTTTIPESQLVAVRRALASLAKQGKVYAGHRGRDGRRLWANERIGLWMELRTMQRANVIDVSEGREDRYRERVDKMLPMLARAQALGIDVNSPDPPALLRSG